MKHESLTGKLLLSSALVAASLAYGWWQRGNAVRPHLAVALLTPDRPLPQSAPAPAMPSAAPDIASAPADAPSKAAAPAPSQNSSAIVKSAPQPNAASVASAAPQAPPQNDAPPVLPAQPLVQQAMPLYPTDDVSPPFPLVTGSPEAGAHPATPAGTHLADGDYISDKHQLEWGDIRVRISVQGGLITGVQILQYPDHRSRSLDLSEMAGPILESEVIKTQKAEVNTVTSATDTSYAFQDTVANAIMRATRE